MSEPFIGEIRMFGGNFAPSGWALCTGQLLPISVYDALFSLLGTAYGGDGRSTFALPDLRGRIPIHQGQGGGSTYVLGQAAGTETVALTAAQMPAHSHAVSASSAAGTSSSPAASVPAATALSAHYATGAPAVPMAAASVSQQGASLPHDNVQPFTCVNFIIALFGIYPPRT